MDEDDGRATLTATCCKNPVAAEVALPMDGVGDGRGPVCHRAEHLWGGR